MAIIQSIKDFFKQNGVSVLLVTVLLFLFTLSFVGEKIPYNNGAGFDGQFYYQVAESFSTDFFTTGYDNFRIFRIFPFFLINLFFSLFSIEPTHANLMHSMFILHYVNLAIQLIFFFKLARLNVWKKATTAIIFACFFFNHFILKNCGYEIFQTDAFASTIFLVSYYYLLREKFVRSIAISFLGILTWPTITYTLWLLYFFKNPFPPNAPRLKFRTGKTLALAFPLMSAGAVALLCLLHKQPLLESMLFTEPSIPLLLTSTIAWGLFLFYILRNCDYRFYSPRQYLRELPLKKFALIAIPYIAITGFLRAYANDEFYFSGIAFILQIFLRPLKYPLITLVGHICYFGILPLLVMIHFRNFSKDIFNRSAGYAIAFLAFIFFATDSEARHVYPLLPMVLVPLASVLDKMELQAKAVFALLALQITLSHFFVQINADGLLEAFEKNEFTTIAQRYFMSYGPWMTFSTYIIWAIISGLAAIFVYFVTKKRKN